MKRVVWIAGATLFIAGCTCPMVKNSETATPAAASAISSPVIEPRDPASEKITRLECGPAEEKPVGNFNYTVLLSPGDMRPDGRNVFELVAIAKDRPANPVHVLLEFSHGDFGFDVYMISKNQPSDVLRFAKTLSVDFVNVYHGRRMFGSSFGGGDYATLRAGNDVMQICKVARK